MPTKVGYIHGTGAALSVEIGFVPEKVTITNLTDGDITFEGFLSKIVVFTSLSAAVEPGYWLKGITSGAKARIREIILDSGTIAGGDAAGWFICDQEDITGTIASENAQIYAAEPGTAAAATNHCGVVVDVVYGITTAAAVAQATTATHGVLPYVGTEATYRKGFTIGTTISEDGKLLGFEAIANDPGQAQEPSVAGVLQSNGVW